ncbi:O-antigen ligase-like membrane protein [Microbacterium sp. SLBN-154]|uniref:O-antigen ligase family protein n=1 Tax=Microbacterium sp. SLBN-154 TaxID=2768458 RepID=UPI00116B13A8|nr:O-antigen ligase family protein [Microbacterium sp. SLBN-154]TQK18623.1 O-antigen ligase-like membrane protein [Microbacterium sp. SLBN-154]
MTALAPTQQSRPSRARISQLPFTAVIGAFWMVVISAPRLISLGPVSLSGAVTILVAVLAVACLPIYAVNTSARRSASGTYEPSRTRVPWPLWGFLLVLATNFVYTASAGQLDVDSIQNLCVYFSFVAAIGFAATARTIEIIDRGWELFRTLGTFASYLCLVMEVTGLTFLGSRPMAIVGLIILAIVVPGKPENLWVLLAPFAMVGALALSLSRTGTAIGILFLGFIVLRGRRGKRLVRGILLVSAAVGALVWMFLYYQPFRDRFLVGDAALQIGGLSISTQGRATFWDLLLANVGENWLIGQGLGSAARLITAYIPSQSHPHNDYLRFYFEFGLLGVSLFLAGYLLLLFRVWKNARVSDSSVHWAALIAMLAVGFVAITDNPFVYPFVMLPVAALAGFSLARARLELASAGLSTKFVDGPAP